MNLPAHAIQNLPLRRAMTDDLTRPLGKLVLAFDPYVDRTAKGAQAYAEAKIALYREVLSDLPEWAIERAVDAFIAGKIEGQHLDRFPTTARLHDAAKAFVDEEAKRQAAARIAQQQIEDRKRTEAFLANRPPAEERARKVKEIMARAGRNME